MKALLALLLGFALVLSEAIADDGLSREKPDRNEEHAIEQQKPSIAREEEPAPLTGTATVGIFNKYIYRGYELSKNSIVIQPAVTASYRGFSACLWGNIDTNEHSTQNFEADKPGRTSFNETDLTLSYTYTKEKFDLTFGYNYYDTKYAPDTQEFFGSISYDVFGKPTLSIYRDTDSYPGTYLNFSLAHSIPIHKEVTVDLGASAGYMWGEGKYWRTFEHSTGEYSGSRYRDLHDGMVKIGLTIPIINNLWLRKKRMMKRLYGDNTVKDRVLRLVDNTHTALSYSVNDYVLADLLHLTCIGLCKSPATYVKRHFL